MPTEEDNEFGHLVSRLRTETGAPVGAADLKSLSERIIGSIVEDSTVLGKEAKRTLDAKLREDLSGLLASHLEKRASVPDGARLRLLIFCKDFGVNLGKPRIGDHGDSLLHLAVRQRQLGTTRWLLENTRLTPLTKNVHGETAISVMIKTLDIGHDDTKQIALELFGNTASLNKEGPGVAVPGHGIVRDGPALYLAAKLSRVDWLRFLLEKGCDSNARSKSGDYALHITDPRNEHLHLDVLECLLDAGADPSLDGKNGQNAFDVFIRKRLSSPKREEIALRMLDAIDEPQDERRQVEILSDLFDAGGMQLFADYLERSSIDVNAPKTYQFGNGRYYSKRGFLFRTLEENDPDRARELMALGADPNTLQRKRSVLADYIWEWSGQAQRVPRTKFPTTAALQLMEQGAQISFGNSAEQRAFVEVVKEHLPQEILSRMRPA